jgi:hypothetical protein
MESEFFFQNILIYGGFHSTDYINKTKIYFGRIIGQVSMDIYFPSNRCTNLCKTQWFYLSVDYIFTVNILCNSILFTTFHFKRILPNFENNEHQKFFRIITAMATKKENEFSHLSLFKNIECLMLYFKLATTPGKMKTVLLLRVIYILYLWNNLRGQLKYRIAMKGSIIHCKNCV